MIDRIKMETLMNGYWLPKRSELDRGETDGHLGHDDGTVD